MMIGKKVFLRGLTKKDIPQLFQWRNDNEISSSLIGWGVPGSIELEEKWFDKIIDDNLNKRFAIVSKDDNQYIGNAVFGNIDWKNRKTEFGIFIGDKKYHGKGLSSDALRASMQYIFMELNFNKIYATVLKTNDKSLNLFKSCKFKEEAMLREEIYRNGQYVNTVIMGILKKEYLKTLKG